MVIICATATAFFIFIWNKLSILLNDFRCVCISKKKSVHFPLNEEKLSYGPSECSMIWGERQLFVLLIILVEFFTITVLDFLFISYLLQGRPVANASNICVGRHTIRTIVVQLAIAQFNWVRCRSKFCWSYINILEFPFLSK